MCRGDKRAVVTKHALITKRAVVTKHALVTKRAILTKRAVPQQVFCGRRQQYQVQQGLGAC